MATSLLKNNLKSNLYDASEPFARYWLLICSKINLGLSISGRLWASSSLKYLIKPFGKFKKNYIFIHYEDSHNI
jgi:hypothetical protein